jgi:multisubunit Na+/H+ antiporter MnhE subunit
MIRAAATSALAGAIWLILTAGEGGWPLTWVFWLTSPLVAVLTLGACARMLGLGAINAAPRLVLLAQRALFAPGGWSQRTLQAAVTPGAAGKPVLVRFRTRIMDEDARAAFGHGLCAGPGLAIVDAQGDSVLLHALDENDADAERRLTALEVAAAAQP